MWEIQDYFGEYIAFYYAFSGALITSLWLPTFIGIAFFVTGVIYRYVTDIGIQRFSKNILKRLILNLKRKQLEFKFLKSHNVSIN